MKYILGAFLIAILIAGIILAALAVVVVTVFCGVTLALTWLLDRAVTLSRIDVLGQSLLVRYGIV